MVEIRHPRTAVIREIIELGYTLYDHSSFQIVMDSPLCTFDRKTPRELINKGQPGEVLKILTVVFESQRI